MAPRLGPVASCDVSAPDDRPAWDHLPPWEPLAPPSAISLTDAARRLGHYAWAELRTFEILGRWTTSIGAPFAGRLAAHANEHALHADAFRRRFPELRELDRDAAATPANNDLVVFFDALDASESVADRLVGAYRVLLPHLAATYRMHANRTSPVSDAPTMRTLRIVLDDDTDQITDGAIMLSTVLTDAEAVAGAASVQAELETLLVAAGGIAGTPGAD